VFAAARTALRKPDGLLVVFDEFYPESLVEGAGESFRSAVHFEYTEMLWGSRVATRAEAESLARGAGFGDIWWEEVLGGGLTVLIARAG
jgi:hypothetical protein